METLAQRWCRMWNDDPTLAHDLVTDDFVMWFGMGDRADPIKGPADLERFVDDYRRIVGARFTPLLESVERDRFAYTWTVEYPDGRTLGGADVYTVVDGRIRENWSVVGERPHLLEPVPSASGRADAEEIVRLVEDWSPVWNGDDIAGRLVSEDFRIWFGAEKSAADDLVGPAGLSAYVAAHRQGREELHFALHRDPVVDVDGRTAACTWTASLPAAESRAAIEVGGIDVFQIVDGRIGRVWSLTGQRHFRF